MGFCGEMRLGRTPEKGTGGSGEGGTTRGQGNFELAAHKVLPADRSNDCRCALARTLVVGMGRFFRKRWRKMRKRRNIH